MIARIKAAENVASRSKYPKRAGSGIVNRMGI
jgi:hypothetical protein